jgi:hypothetical protein
MVSVCHLPLLSERHRRVSWIARRFLARRASRTGGEIDIEDLASAEISAYLLEVTARLVVESAKREAADLRALLRFFTCTASSSPTWTAPCRRSQRGGARGCPDHERGGHGRAAGEL